MIPTALSPGLGLPCTVRSWRTERLSARHGYNRGSTSHLYTLAGQKTHGHTECVTGGTKWKQEGKDDKWVTPEKKEQMYYSGHRSEGNDRRREKAALGLGWL